MVHGETLYTDCRVVKQIQGGEIFYTGGKQIQDWETFYAGQTEKGTSLVRPRPDVGLGCEPYFSQGI